MKYLIDTDIASYYLRGRYNLFDIFEEKGIQNIKLSRITVAELEVLAHRSLQSKINFSAIHSFSQKLGVLEVGKETWQIFSMMKAETLNRGRKKGDLDILIASIAKQYEMILITNNTSHYEDLIKVENWIENCK
jgi:tRNA(fMet)-specific endonuclease VapC